MSDALYDRLMLRFRNEYSDLTDEEYEAYTLSLLQQGSRSLLEQLKEKGSPKVTTHMVYKTIEVRGKTRRVPVTMTTQQKPDDIPEALRSEGGCLMLRSLLGLTDTEQDFAVLLEEADFAIDVPLGFVEVGDVIFYEGVWGVVDSIQLSANTFSMARICDTFELIEGLDLTKPHVAYRMYL